jgi:uncharacterized protein YheU (UPF0270 family)
MIQTKDTEKPIEVPATKLSEQALAGIIENFIVREGTDYGAVEISYEKKCEQIRRQIDRGDIKIIYDQSTDTISLITERDYKRLLANR